MHRAFLNIKNLLCILCISVVFIFSAFPAFALEYEDYPVVKLRSLDKITARTMTFEAKVGSTVRFGEIFIKVQSCRKPPPVEKSEAAAFLQVWQSDEIKQTSKWIFSGWMFASSPALSAMDHPVYDVWVLDCLGRDPEPIPPPETSATPAPATDGAAPNAVPPSVEPDKAAVDQTVDETVDGDDDVTDDSTDDVPEETVPTTNIPEGAKPTEPATPQSAPQTPATTYAPAQDTPDTYQDDSSPKDDTPAPETVKPETLEPEPEKKPETKQEFQGIY